MPFLMVIASLAGKNEQSHEYATQPHNLTTLTIESSKKTYILTFFFGEFATFTEANIDMVSPQSCHLYRQGASDGGVLFSCSVLNCLAVDTTIVVGSTMMTTHHSCDRAKRSSSTRCGQAKLRLEHFFYVAERLNTLGNLTSILYLGVESSRVDASSVPTLNRV